MYTLYFVVKKVMDNAGMFYVEGTTPFYYGARMIEKKLANFDSSYLKAFSFGPLVYSVTFFFMKKQKVLISYIVDYQIRETTPRFVAQSKYETRHKLK